MNLKRCSFYSLAGIALAMAAGAPAAAQSDAAIAAAGRACLAIDSDDRRLACFERAFNTDAAIRSASPAPVAQPAASRETEQASDELAPQQLRIVGTREIRPGDVRFETADGEFYYYDGSSTRPLSIPDTPFMATLERGALGSRFLRFGPENSQRVRVAERD